VPDPTGLLPVLWEAILDPLDGNEVRAEAVRRLGEDPGDTGEAWAEAVGRVGKGGGR
jgi:hypothetical protein